MVTGVSERRDGPDPGRVAAPDPGRGGAQDRATAVPPRPQPTHRIPAGEQSLGLHLEVPDGPGPWPAVVVIHDAAGLTADTVHQCRWLADAGTYALLMMRRRWLRDTTSVIW